MSRQPSIFISHKHSDRKIATELRQFLDRLSRKEIPVFQSSDPLAAGPRPGYTLTTELKQALWETGIVFLIYTSPDQDWSYCMWECGVATKPDAPQSKIIVLQCSNEIPKVFDDQVCINVHSQNDILKLVKSLLTDIDFFPGCNKAIAPNLSPDGPEVKDAAIELFTKLTNVLPKQNVAEWSAHPFLRLELKSDCIESIINDNGNLDNCKKFVTVSDISSDAFHIFNIARADTDMRLCDLIQHWTTSKPDGNLSWVSDLNSQIKRAVKKEVPVPQWSRLIEADGIEEYTPLLSTVRQVPALDSLQFDIHFLQFRKDLVLSSMDDPFQKEYLKAKENVRSFTNSLFPFFTPVAARFFNDWAEYIRRVVFDGAEMRGPERLEITRLLIHATQKHTLIEKVIGNPLKLHSRDWLSLYDEIGAIKDIEKVWILCVDETEVSKNIDNAKSAWTFFKEKNFKTLYCSPKEVERSGDEVPKYDVIEDFGEYVKLLFLPQGSYTAGAKANSLNTLFKVARDTDRRLFRSMIDYSVPMSEEFFLKIRESV